MNYDKEVRFIEINKLYNVDLDPNIDNIFRSLPLPLKHFILSNSRTFYIKSY